MQKRGKSQFIIYSSLKISPDFNISNVWADAHNAN